MEKQLALTLALCASLIGFGCDGSTSMNDGDGGTSSSGDLATGEGPCDEASQCRGDVCVAIPTDRPAVYCSEECTADASCPSGFVCDQETFGLIGLRFCRPGDAADPPPPAPAPKLPCMDDADCDRGTICGRIDGEATCLVPCDVEDDCTPPAMGGFVLDLATCGTEDGGRTVCLPDPACSPDPQVCITTGGFPGAP